MHNNNTIRKLNGRIVATLERYENNPNHPARSVQFSIQQIMALLFTSEVWDISRNYKDAMLNLMVRAEKIQGLRLRMNLKSNATYKGMAHTETIAALKGAQNLISAMIG